MNDSSLTDRLFTAVRAADDGTVADMLDAQPDLIHAREERYGWSPLHASAHTGRLLIVDMLLERGMDPNTREHGDNTTPMHWAAAAGHADVVRRLADAGGDVVGQGDDHELQVIGWATCWDGCDDEPHGAVTRLLLERGAQHHVFSAIAVNDAAAVRRLVSADSAVLSRRMSRNEAHQLPLHFAVRKNRPEMVGLLLALGADPSATDDAGHPAIDYAASSGVSRAVIETLASHGPAALTAALLLDDIDLVATLTAHHEALTGGRMRGALHLCAKRGSHRAVQWLLANGADVNALWSHWGAEVSALHLAAWQGHSAVVQTLLAAGADPTLRDSMHDGDARDWAEHGGQIETREQLEHVLDRRQTPPIG